MNRAWVITRFFYMEEIIATKKEIKMLNFTYQ